jgi:hypothetical protein
MRTLTKDDIDPPLDIGVYFDFNIVSGFGCYDEIIDSKVERFLFSEVEDKIYWSIHFNTVMEDYKDFIYANIN